jgi:hypothetical protein
MLISIGVRQQVYEKPDMAERTRRKDSNFLLLGKEQNVSEKERRRKGRQGRTAGQSDRALYSSHCPGLLTSALAHLFLFVFASSVLALYPFLSGYCISKTDVLEWLPRVFFPPLSWAVHFTLT